MALFSRNKKADTPEAVQKAGKQHAVAPGALRNLSTVLVRSRVTEKAVGKADQNVYTFVVRRDATKYDVRDAVKEYYNVTPVRVNVVNQAPAVRHSGSRGRRMKVAGLKKAYVYLKKGDTINLV